MQIKITDLQNVLKKAKNGKAYNELTVFFEKDGESKSRKLTSYDKVNFPFFANIPKQSLVEVTSFQDDAGFWNWKDPKVIGSGQAVSAPTSGKTAKAGDYEDVRQLRIVRQSCLKAAAELVASPHYKDIQLPVEATKALAEDLVAWVYAPVKPLTVVEELEDEEETEGVE